MRADCHAIHDKDKCLGSHCLWCRSAAVPSACYTEEEAGQLPPAVFECDKSLAVTADRWTLREVPRDVDALFAAWKQTHGKFYASAIEDEMRRAVFEENARLVAAHNSRNDVSFTMELNKFADLTWAEFKNWYLGAPQNCSATHKSSTLVKYDDEVPEEKDWRTQGAVTPVKNQGKCGSCWTFSSTGCLESHNILKNGKSVLLSEQQLLDCAQAFDNHGCNGGLPSHAFEYIHYNGGLDTEDTYPYEAKEGKCKFNTYHVGVRVDTVVNITARNEVELKAAVGTTGPVSVAFQVVKDFRFYKSGVYESKECHSGEQDVNHAVLAVGYGLESGKKHWIIKNSWGANWGMSGYFQIKRDENMCGIADCASYPIVH